MECMIDYKFIVSAFTFKSCLSHVSQIFSYSKIDDRHEINWAAFELLCKNLTLVKVYFIT